MMQVSNRSAASGNTAQMWEKRYGETRSSHCEMCPPNVSLSCVQPHPSTGKSPCNSCLAYWSDDEARVVALILSDGCHNFLVPENSGNYS